jgi:recombination protein RecR
MLNPSSLPVSPAPISTRSGFSSPVAGVSPPLQSLIDQLARLPGVGSKTAQRLAFFLLKQPEAYIDQLAFAMKDAYHRVKPCSTCFHLSCDDPCEICSNDQRNPQQICVVMDTRDVLAIERTHQYRGLYHVLGGVLSPLDNVGPDQLTIQAFLERVQAWQANHAPDDTAHLEIIVALPPTTEGDTTTLYLTRQLQGFSKTKLSRIAFGLPVGGDLDYTDNLTIVRALQGRMAL